MAVQNQYNNEELLIRAIIAGVLNILNNKLTYKQTWSNDDIEDVIVPFWYNFSGDERFMQDFYTHFAHCLPPKPVDGNFDKMPRGMVTYTGSQIDPARITSRYIQGNFLKEVNGQLQTYHSFLYSIPLNVNFDVEMWLDSQVTQLKLEQAIREVFYKTTTFYVYFRGMRVGCTAGFPEDITLEKNILYSFETGNTTVPKLKFSLQVEAYQPVFDPTTEVNANTVMTGLGFRLIDKNVADNDGYITITTNYTGNTFPKGYPLLLEWEYINENAIINKVDILWSNTGENERFVIEKGVPNHEYYVWNIPETFTTYKNPSIIWTLGSATSFYREPIIRILPDPITKEITENSFIVIDPGYIISPISDASINIVLEMKDANNKVVYSGDASIYINIEDYKISETNPATLPFGNIIFPGNIEYKEIDIYVVNSVTGYSTPLPLTTDSQAYGVIRNIKIV